VETDRGEVPVAVALPPEGREGAPPALSYRPPRDDPPGASAGDVFQGAAAAVLFVIMLLGFGGMAFMAFNRSAISADVWGLAEWIFFGLGSLLLALGAAAAFRSLRYYLTGRHRRRVALEREP